MTSLIALDWGTSALRAYRFAENGSVTEQRTLPHGIMKLPDVSDRMKGLQQAFHLACGDWLAAEPGCPVLASGMIGSAQGWQTAPYLPVPCSVDQLAKNLTRVDVNPEHQFFIVPGVRLPGTLPEVMRGEETQIFGALTGDSQLAIEGESLIVLPGTHSKWVSVVKGEISGLRTFMSGEIYDVMRSHSILGLTMQLPDSPDWQAFAEGVNVARQRPGELLGTLFSVRTRWLCGQLSPQQQPDYLSGLLLGNELVTALSNAGIKENIPVTFIGASALCQRYLRALTLLEYRNPAHIANGAAEQGMWQIARYAGLVA